MTILRRLLLLWLFLFWQGGFLFYAAVVVAVGSNVLGGDFAQGLITRHVTNWLNLIGLIVLLAWIGDLAVERGSRLKRRWAVWCFLLLCLAALAWLHPRMDALIAVDQDRVLSRSEFRFMHRLYLHISTAQWLGSIVFTFWTLQNWRAADWSERVERISHTPDCD